MCHGGLPKTLIWRPHRLMCFFPPGRRTQISLRLKYLKVVCFVFKAHLDFKIILDWRQVLLTDTIQLKQVFRENKDENCQCTVYGLKMVVRFILVILVFDKTSSNSNPDVQPAKKGVQPFKLPTSIIFSTLRSWHANACLLEEQREKCAHGSHFLCESFTTPFFTIYEVHFTGAAISFTTRSPRLNSSKHRNQQQIKNRLHVFVSDLFGHFTNEVLFTIWFIHLKTNQFSWPMHEIMKDDLFYLNSFKDITNKISDY